MRQYTSWSVILFRWRRLHVRVHMLFLLFAACTLFLSSSHHTAGGSSGVWIAAAAMGILLLSVLAHEMGHYFTASSLGGDGRLLVLWPLGGLCPLHPPLNPRHELLMHVAGPAVNLGVCLLSGVVVATHVGAEWIGLLHPLAPRNLFVPTDTGALLQTAKLVFWCNWVLLLVNLLPAFPFDGGRALRSALTAMNPDMGTRRAAYIVATVAKIAALVLLVLAAFWWSDKSNPVLPVWFSLVLLALLLYFSARQEEERADDAEPDEEMFGYDFSQGFTSLERTSQFHAEHVSPFRRWLEDRRQAREQRRKQIESDEEHRVDEILSRLHDQGMSSLSVEDRSLLKRVSERLRHRQGKDG